MSKRMERALIAFVLGFVLVWIIGPVIGQEFEQEYYPRSPGVGHQYEGQGEHPKPGERDPYARATSMGGQVHCCHSTDCAPWVGAEPKQVFKDGQFVGFQFGQWFLPKARMIDPETLPADIKGEHHICIRSGQVLCGWVAAGF
jgi:hypothetical protein